MKFATWGKIAGAILWLGALSAGVQANATAIKQKADAQTIMHERAADRELLAAKLDLIIEQQKAMDARVGRIEQFQQQQVQLALEAAGSKRR